MKPNYRLTFSGEGNSKNIDIYAKDSDNAFKKANQMPEAKSGRYTDVIVEEIPTEPSVIGIEFEYTDTAIKRDFHGYIFIKAKDENQAVEYYNANYKGKRFWFNASETKEDGKCIRGKVIKTYFAGCPGYDADTTIA